MNNSEYRILCESKHFIVKSSYETVYLINKDNNTETIIGDFYDDPDGAIIDIEERYVVIFGCGVIVYYLKKPFIEYSYNACTTQWLEFGRNNPVIWIEKVVHISSDKIQLITEDNSKININV